MTLRNTLSGKRRAATEATANGTAMAKQSAMPALLSERDAAAYTGVSVGFLRRARSEGSPGRRTAGPLFVRLETFGGKGGKNGGRVMYAVKDIDEWLTSLERKRVIWMTSPVFLPVRAESIPVELKALPQWVIWKA
ncbi:MAG: hypothetical protein LBS35_13375 [Synergistaceae bacterium]|jgi:hypothetical protein|nr:hypothetical protein [Synergistaceae bacterium]